jgi:hypothetical protein
MERKKLAHEIRSAGFALRYADGPVMRFSFRDGQAKKTNQSLRKLRSSDAKIISLASTCSQCDAVASHYDIEFATDAADCYQSFARLIWPCIDHDPVCDAEPYLSVSGKATKSFAKVKARFDAMQQRQLEELEAQLRKLQSEAPRRTVKKSGKKATKKVIAKKKAERKVSKKATKKASKRKPPKK